MVKEEEKFVVHGLQFVNLENARERTSAAENKDLLSSEEKFADVDSQRRVKLKDKTNALVQQLSVEELTAKLSRKHQNGSELLSQTSGTKIAKKEFMERPEEEQDVVHSREHVLTNSVEPLKRDVNGQDQLLIPNSTRDVSPKRLDYLKFKRNVVTSPNYVLENIVKERQQTVTSSNPSSHNQKKNAELFLSKKEDVKEQDVANGQEDVSTRSAKTSRRNVSGEEQNHAEETHVTVNGNKETEFADKEDVVVQEEHATVNSVSPRMQDASGMEREFARESQTRNVTGSQLERLEDNYTAVPRRMERRLASLLDKL